MNSVAIRHGTTDTGSVGDFFLGNVMLGFRTRPQAELGNE